MPCRRASCLPWLLTTFFFYHVLSELLKVLNSEYTTQFLVFARFFMIILLYCGEKDSCDDHWRRQLWGTGARAPSTSNCLIFQVTSEPHKLWHSTPRGCLPSRNYSLSFVPPSHQILVTPLATTGCRNRCGDNLLTAFDCDVAGFADFLILRLVADCVARPSHVSCKRTMKWRREQVAFGICWGSITIDAVDAGDRCQTGVTLLAAAADDDDDDDWITRLLTYKNVHAYKRKIH